MGMCHHLSGVLTSHQIRRASDDHGKQWGGQEGHCARVGRSVGDNEGCNGVDAEAIEDNQALNYEEHEMVNLKTFTL
jgi:hypothetical protein